MDTDGNGEVDRIEWMCYVFAPREPGQVAKGNADYYDFDLRDSFVKVDKDNDGEIGQLEVIELIIIEYKRIHDQLDDMGKGLLRPAIKKVADYIINTINEDVHPANCRLNWEDIKPYRKLAGRQKDDLVVLMEARIVEQQVNLQKEIS